MVRKLFRIVWPTHTHTHSYVHVHKVNAWRKRKITRRNSTLTRTQWHHPDLMQAARRNGFGCFSRDIVSLHVVVYFLFCSLLFLLEDARFFIHQVCRLRTPRCSYCHFELACHGPLLMNNYYSKYLVYIVHLHGLFNYAIRILINPNSFLLFVGHRAKLNERAYALTPFIPKKRRA